MHIIIDFMAEERKFPLIIWQQTDEFKTEYESAQKKLDELHKKWVEKYGGGSYVGSLRFDANCKPEFWINDFGGFATGRFCGQKMKWSSEEALRSALRYGDSGWWNLEDLEQIIERKGWIIEEAMFDCGFRRHKDNPEKWVRRKKGDQDPYIRRMENKHKKEIANLSTEEAERLRSEGELFVLPNEFAGLNNTYSIEANNKGMVYVELSANPFSGSTAETLHCLEAVLEDRGHIAKNQNGFSIGAKNVKINNEEGVLVKAVRNDDIYFECIWPSHTAKENIYYLADRLVSTLKISDNIYRNFCLSTPTSAV